MREGRRKTQTERLRERVVVVLRLERDGLENFALATALAAPLSLLATSGWLFVAGVIYAVTYVLIMILPTALFVVIAYDALRVALRRRAVFVPHLWALAKVTSAATAVDSDPPITSVLALGITGNPLSTLVREMWLFALRFNKAAIAQIDDDADKLAKEMRPAGMTGRLIAREVRSVPEHEREIDLVATC